ncbi:hypothetical protein CALCODRAFT_486478 [Calocera cornea HHB12733]|uniref:Uncharacterized protein n=1 Tax=Calocera cornea HHB12733 TaxID=1353952 RepID=A0A165DPE4_9BASI|nr:hypothetical protein CALCODRAFT_486478 [Calocera cornea HHB12733]
MSRPTRPLLVLSVLSALLRFVNAQFIDIPSSLGQCQTLALSWQPTSAPYTVSVLNSSTSLPLERLSPTTSPTAQWTTDLPPGTSLLFQLQDADDRVFDSAPVLITQGSGDCMAQGAMTGEGTLLFNSAQAPGTVALSSVAPSALPTQLISATLPSSSGPAPTGTTSIDPDDPPTSSAVFSGPVYSEVPGGYVPVEPSSGISYALNSGGRSLLPLSVLGSVFTGAVWMVVTLLA